MDTNKTTLMVLAAGMGSRFGGLKQIEPLGPNGEVILDPFLGVGSTLIAAKKLAKRGIGIDLNPEYLKIAKTRKGGAKL